MSEVPVSSGESPEAIHAVDVLAQGSCFLSHGAPTLALDPGRTGASWRALAKAIPRPRAILVVSAHWESRSPIVSAALRPETIHDFGGFPPALYTLQYPAPGAPVLAGRVKDVLDEAGIDCAIDPTRGLDHGAWVPLMSLYPKADVPVMQLSIQPHRDPAWHYRVGQALRPLGAEGVLVLASGSLTHNLRDVRWQAGEGAGEPYAIAFSEWFADRVAAADLAALLDYRARAPGAVRAHPTDEHLLPFHVALGAAPVPGGARRIDNGYTLGVLAMDAYVFEAGAAAA